MKNVLVLLFVVLLTGCAETTQRIENIVDDPGTILQDPGFAEYEQKLNDLEKRQLRKEITYADYLEQKKKLDEDYSRVIQKQKTEVDDPLYNKGRTSDETFR